MGPATVRRVAIAALLLAGASVLGNAVLLWRLRHPESWARPALARLLGELAGSDASFRYEVRLPAGTPLRLDIPVDERFAVRVDTLIPIRTRVRVPLESPLGSHTITLPIRADIPLRTTVPLHIRHTFELRTETTQEIVVPLEIRLEDLPVEEWMGSRK